MALSVKYESPVRILGIEIHESDIQVPRAAQAPFAAFPPIEAASLRIPPILGCNSMCLLDFTQGVGSEPSYVGLSTHEY